MLPSYHLGFIDHVEIIGVNITGKATGELEEMGVEPDGHFHAFVIVIYDR